MPICFKLFMQKTALAFSLAKDKAGNNNAARMEMIAMTTSNSMSVKAPKTDLRFRFHWPSTAQTFQSIVIRWKFTFVVCITPIRP